MEQLEMVEKLAAKAGITLAEARTALEENDWNMLDALIALEKSGKLGDGKVTGNYSTAAENTTAENAGEKAQEDASGKRSDWDDFKRGLAKLIKKGISNRFVVTRKGDEIICIPVLLLLAVVCLCFWVALPLLVIGLFLECRYSFRGEDLGRKKVNDAMDKASCYADDLKQSIRSTLEEDKNK